MPKQEPLQVTWRELHGITSLTYTCGYCGNLVASDKGMFTNQNGHAAPPLIQICPHCQKPTLLDADGIRYPSPRTGKEVNHVPNDLNSLYGEARDCISVNAYTAVVHLCRTAIAHIAVQKEAKHGQNFKHYVEYLRDNHYIPIGSDVWVNQIRELGNEVTHELTIADEETAMTILGFVEMLLRITFEYPAAATRLNQPEGTPS